MDINRERKWKRSERNDEKGRREREINDIHAYICTKMEREERDGEPLRNEPKMYKETEQANEGEREAER